jgi:hypothetical protein
VLLAIGVSGCGLFLGTDDLSFDATSGTEAAGTNAASNTSAQGTGGSGASGGSSVNAGGTGGSPSSTSTSTAAGGSEGLIDQDVLARYFIDEAASGTPPVNALDSAPLPADLGLRFDGNAHYTEVNGQRGIQWDVAAGDSDAFFVIANDLSGKLWQLNGATEATLELVVDVDAAAPMGSPLMYFGSDNTPFGALAVWTDDSSVAVVLGTSAGGLFNASLVGLGRVVLHAVIAPSSIALYVDGMPASSNGNPVPATIDLADSSHFLLGNDRTYAASMSGIIHYVAIYLRAFGTSEVTHNAQLLAISDDTQP